MNVILTLNFIQLQNKSLKQWLLHPKQCFSPPHRASNKHTLLEDCLHCSYQFKYILFFYLQSQHGWIKSWVRGSSVVWPVITYAPVIWLYWLWAACCAMLLGLGNIKLIIASDRQSICQCVELGGWADGLFASLPLPRSDICAVIYQQAWHQQTAGNHVFIPPPIYPWGMMLYTHWTYSSSHTLPFPPQLLLRENCHSNIENLWLSAGRNMSGIK